MWQFEPIIVSCDVKKVHAPLRGIAEFWPDRCRGTFDGMIGDKRHLIYYRISDYEMNRFLYSTCMGTRVFGFVACEVNSFIRPGCWQMERFFYNYSGAIKDYAISARRR